MFAIRVLTSSFTFPFPTARRPEAMSFVPEEQRFRNQNAVSRQRSSSIRRSPNSSGQPQDDCGCCRSLAEVFSAFSEMRQPTHPRHHQQVAALKEEVIRQRDLRSVYKARLKRMEDYLRYYCLDIAEDRFLDHIIHGQQRSPTLEFEHEPSPEKITGKPGDPHLEAMKSMAKLGGWKLEPHEIELHEKIGRGTTADIYRGTWRGLDVAIKWIYPHYFEKNEAAETWFAQELATLSRQRHPFVLRLMGACLDPPENGWMVTELLSGKTLTEWLYGHKERQRERSAPLPPLRERIEKGLEIAQAMQYLHEQKPRVIHRDLKPSNILLDDSMHVRVADFGHARFLPDGEQALTGEMGTYVYMAPEVIRCEPYDEKCDVYSFGIILNELITGQHPYSESGLSPSKIALEVAEGRLRPKLPEDDDRYKNLIDLICNSWDEDASRRPSFAIITSTLRNIQEMLS